MKKRKNSQNCDSPEERGAKIVDDLHRWILGWFCRSIHLYQSKDFSYICASIISEHRISSKTRISEDRYRRITIGVIELLRDFGLIEQNGLHYKATTKLENYGTKLPDLEAPNLEIYLDAPKKGSSPRRDKILEHAGAMLGLMGYEMTGENNPSESPLCTSI